jgi:hypothetical protein
LNVTWNANLERELGTGTQDIDREPFGRSPKSSRRLLDYAMLAGALVMAELGTLEPNLEPGTWNPDRK